MKKRASKYFTSLSDIKQHKSMPSTFQYKYWVHLACTVGLVTYTHTLTHMYCGPDHTHTHTHMHCSPRHIHTHTHSPICTVVLTTYTYTLTYMHCRPHHTHTHTHSPREVLPIRAHHLDFRNSTTRLSVPAANEQTRGLIAACFNCSNLPQGREGGGVWTEWGEGVSLWWVISSSLHAPGDVCPPTDFLCCVSKLTQESVRVWQVLGQTKIPDCWLCGIQFVVCFLLCFWTQNQLKECFKSS